MELPLIFLITSFLILFYSYVGYGILLYTLVVIKRLFYQTKPTDFTEWPEVTLVVAAYNEEDFIEEKILNSLGLDYPADKLKLLFVTDGSTDKTNEIIRQYSQIRLEYEPGRRGKIAAVDRIMSLVASPITIYTDANTYLNPEAVRKMVRHFSNPNVGAVAGEKRIQQYTKNDASTTGEGLYWRYESALKQWDYELHTVVGAAGELFAIRTALYEPVQQDTLIEDFYMTLRIAQVGYRVAYENNAFAVEDGSASIQEEMKRKVRIAAGGLQAIIRLVTLLFPYPHPVLTFQYVSHRVLRWTLAPLALVVFLVASAFLAIDGSALGMGLLILQLLFYFLAYAGFQYEKREVSIKLLYVPLYFSMMNLAVYMGAWRLWKGQQSVVWDKAKRKAKL